MGVFFNLFFGSTSSLPLSFQLLRVFSHSFSSFSLYFIMAFIVEKPAFLHKELKWFKYMEWSGGQVSRDLGLLLIGLIMSIVNYTWPHKFVYAKHKSSLLFPHNVFTQIISVMMQISSDMAVSIQWCSLSLIPRLCVDAILVGRREVCVCGLNNQMHLHLTKSCLAPHEVVWECVRAGIYTWFLMTSCCLLAQMGQLQDVRHFLPLNFCMCFGKISLLDIRPAYW